MSIVFRKTLALLAKMTPMMKKSHHDRVSRCMVFLKGKANKARDEPQGDMDGSQLQVNEVDKHREDQLNQSKQQASEKEDVLFLQASLLGHGWLNLPSWVPLIRLSTDPPLPFFRWSPDP